MRLEVEKIKANLRTKRRDPERALANPVENAVHYTCEGGRVSIEAHVEHHPTLIRIRDTGIGIPTPEQSKISDRFFRAPNAKAADSGGTGLGLAIVKKVVDQHQDQIDCTSVVGEGTQFTLLLPTLNGVTN